MLTFLVATTKIFFEEKALVVPRKQNRQAEKALLEVNFLPTNTP
jgi:hypothetical protein